MCVSVSMCDLACLCVCVWKIMSVVIYSQFGFILKSPGFNRALIFSPRI